MKKLIFWIAILVSVTGIAQKKKETKTPTPSPVATPLQNLEKEIARLSEWSGGKLGVCAVHIETGRRVVQLGQEPFPMASSYKIPIAVQLLSRVDSGKLNLDQLIEIQRSDLHPGSGMIGERFNWPGDVKPGVALSVRSLLELMLLISDNSATDLCLKLAGGPGAVNACMARLGVKGVRVDRPTSLLIADWLGVSMPAGQGWSGKLFDSLARQIKPEQRKSNSKYFDSDIRDSSTPEGMADLLLKIYSKPILKTETKALLLDILKRCETGLARLKGALPPGTEVAHKTGTIGMTTNDVGIITLPGDGGHVVVAAFVKSSEKEIPARERAIAEVTRVIFDYFVLIR